MRIFLLVLISVFFLLCCEKDNYKRKNEIQIGDKNNMVINYYDTLLIGEYWNAQFFDTDLDNDGINDIQFESNYWGSPGGGYNRSSTIRCLNSDVELFGFYTSDTLFWNRDTVIYELTDDPFFNFSKYVYCNYTCSRIDVSDTILNVSSAFKIIPLNSGDKLKIEDTFSTNVLIEDPSGETMPIERVSGDTIIYIYQRNYNDCISFPLSDTNYIGFRLKNEKLGWIKISIFNVNQILIHEIGIQK
jgi:hypothetical protein